MICTCQSANSRTDLQENIEFGRVQLFPLDCDCLQEGGPLDGWLLAGERLQGWVVLGSNCFLPGVSERESCHWSELSRSQRGKIARRRLERRGESKLRRFD